MRRSEKADNLTDKSIGTVFYVGVTGEQEDNVSNVHYNVIVDIVDATSFPIQLTQFNYTNR